MGEISGARRGAAQAEERSQRPEELLSALRDPAAGGEAEEERFARHRAEDQKRIGKLEESGEKLPFVRAAVEEQEELLLGRA